MLNTKPPKDQRAGIRPISFVLQRGGSFGTPVTLKIRPEDLTRTEPSRINVTQTLGREVSGWVDNFGQSLPSVTISGHTGWRTAAGSGEDGAEAFETLNTLIVEEYHAAKQAAIDAGTDPATVKLLFVDMLDNFAWNVAPMQFVLRRSKSRPLLFQYNIQMQAISTSIDTQFMARPFLGTIASGLGAFGNAIQFLKELSANIRGWITDAVAFKDRALTPIANTVKQFADFSNQAFDITYLAIAEANNGIFGTANDLIGISRNLATVGVNIFRTFSGITGIPDNLKASLIKVASAYNEVVCIFSNSLRPSSSYENYDGLYGASNCSSTTGGRQPSLYGNVNAFSLMQLDKGPISVSSNAYSGINAISRSDLVLAPMALSEMARNLTAINDGVRISA